jgi:sensor histidine kinase YesM
MSWHDLIFSNQSKHRIRRHLVSWLLWWAFIILTVFFYAHSCCPKKVSATFFSTSAGPRKIRLLFIQFIGTGEIFSAYTHSYIFLLCHHLYFITRFQLKKKYWLLVPGVVLSFILVTAMGYFLYTEVYPFIDHLFGLHLPEPDRFIVFRSIDASLVNAIKVTLIAVAIALLKRWWIKQKEKEQLEKERINAEVQLLKAQIHPAFLFNTLNNITSEAKVASPKAPKC